MYYSNTPDYHVQQQMSSFMWGVYGWMSCALMVTAYIAYTLSLFPKYIYAIITNPALMIVLMIVQLGLVLGISFALPRLSFPAAVSLFVLYAATVGVTLSTIFLAYTTVSIVTTFITCAGMFGSMALYGYFTRADLTGIGSIALMILIGMMIAMIVNMFIQSAAFDFVLSGIGVIVFSLLTAYDTQKIKHLGAQLLVNGQDVAKITILGALALYLDFINLFLFLLRFMGNRRQD